MKPITEIRKILKAAKAAGITTTSGKGSHVILKRADGKSFSLSGTGKKETSVGVAKGAWVFINEA